jgi:predicted RNase H-like HicB family nuclease
VKSYIFKVVIEPDEDKWRALVPELESRGAATWGKTREEALRNIQEVAQMVIEEMLEDGEPIPGGVMICDEPRLAVTV